MQSPWLQVFVGGLRWRCRRVRRWISIGLFRKSLQTAKFSRVPWQKSSLKGRVSFGTRANFGISFTTKGAIFGRTSHGPGSKALSTATSGSTASRDSLRSWPASLPSSTITSQRNRSWRDVKPFSLLTWEGRHRLVPHRFELNQEAARYGREPKIKAHQSHPQTEGDMG